MVYFFSYYIKIAVELFLIAKKLYVYYRKFGNKESREIKTPSKVSRAYNVLICLLLTLFQRIY